MSNNLGTRPVNGEKIRMRFVIATLFNMIGGSSSNGENKEINRQVEEIQKSETKGAIDKLEKRMLQSYKEGKMKTKKGPKVKEAEFKLQDTSKIKEKQKEQNKNKDKNKGKTENTKIIDDDYVK